MIRTRLILALFSLGALCSAAENDQAMQNAHRWVAAKFQGTEESAPAVPYLLVSLKSGTIAKDNIQGHPLLIAGRKFDRGVAMRSPGEVRVVLPAGAESFESGLGVDSNDVGYYSNSGRGMVVASIESNGKELYRSPVLHEGLKSIPVKVNLGGAREFSLHLTAVGERSSTYQSEWDQADWAEARITLSGGAVLHLADLPLGPLAENYSLDPPFSFQYAGRPSNDFFKTWPVQRTTRPIGNHRTEYTQVYTDPATHLELRCVAVAYDDFPTVEWTLHLKNNGAEPTPILENIQALNVLFERNAEGEFLLHHGKGSDASPNDYEPLETILPARAQAHFASVGGRPTDGDLPYFNLAWPGGSVVLALAWPGQWDARFSRDDSRNVRITAGQEGTHFRLLPGEEVRTPLAVVQFTDGDWLDGQNVWRRWMIAHNLPRPDGKLPPPQLAAGSSRHTVEMQGATEQNQIEYIQKTLARGIPIDHWWMDAGWYPFKKNWSETGTWTPDPKRLPHGFTPISAAAHAHGLKTIVWFEPERVAPGTWLYEHHPEWLIGPDGKDKLLFLGNHKAWDWLVDHVSKIIAEQGIDVYRQDFNFAPLSRWRSHDAPDRQGITEIQDVEGYLAYFDELLRRFPNLMIDTCASGGRRNDLETLRRAVPLWRSDHAFEPVSMQAETYGMALWIPYFGTAINSSQPYVFRSQMTPASSWSLEPENEEGYGRLIGLLKQWRELSGFYYGDYYPLTEYSLDHSAWMGWQFNRPGRGDGMVQAFRREKSPFVAAKFKLRGLKPQARYTVKDLDSRRAVELTGRDLMDDGLPVAIPETPGARILVYHLR